MAFQFPWTNFHELNLDWFLSKFKQFTNNYLGTTATAESVPYGTQPSVTVTGGELDDDTDIVDPFTFNFKIPAGQQGEQGEQGVPGPDGFSPIATVTKSGNTATISITDKNGTTTATVIDGGLELDDTLTQSGKAADAKATGDAIDEVKSSLKDVSASQLSGYFNLLKIFNNVTIYNNTRAFGFTATNTETTPTLYSESGYTTAIIPISDVAENAVITLFAPGSTAPTSYCIWGRYSSYSSAYNQVTPNLIANYSGWDASYNSSTKELTVNIQAIKQVTTDMLVFCWYDQYAYISPTSLQSLDSGTIQLKNIIGKDQLTTDIQNIINNSELEQSATLVLPRRIPIVSGVQLGIYYENILYGKYLKTTFVNRQQDNIAGTFRDDSWHFTPNVTSTITNGTNFRFYPYSLNNYTVYSTNITMIPKSYAPGTYKGIVIGDSKIAQGTIMNTLANLFNDDGTTIVQFLGTLQTSSGIKHEGRSGWSSRNYCESASYNGSSNAFLFNGVFNFGQYLSTNNIDTPDFVCINLGTNDVVNGLTYDQILNYYQTMINSIHAVNTNIKVIIGLTENLCQLQFNYSTTKDRILGLVKAMITKWDNETAYNAKIYLCPIYVNMNLYKDYNFSNVAESDRNPELIPFPTDYVHQSVYGFYKNADMIYSSIKYFLGI